MTPVTLVRAQASQFTRDAGRRASGSTTLRGRWVSPFPGSLSQNAISLSQAASNQKTSSERVSPPRAAAAQVDSVGTSAGAVEECDVVVIGAGIGGLSCAAMLAKYGFKVIVCESHSIPGGAAHAWVRDGYHFEAGPSLYSGMAATGPSANPIAHVFQAIGEPLELIEYETWNVIVPEGEFLTKVGAEQFKDVLAELRGPAAVAEWDALQVHMKPYAKAAAALPACSIRFDPAVAITAGRFLPSLLSSGPAAMKLTGPFSAVANEVITDPFIKNWLDLLSFLLSGLPADGTVAAEVAFMFNEWYRPDCKLEFPKGGSQSMVQALIRGVKKKGGKIMLNAHVDEILMEDGRAAGVKLASGKVIKAGTRVVSNADSYNTMKMLPSECVPESYKQGADDLPNNPSFMHLHLGFDATGLPEDLEMHHIVVNTWEGGVTSEQNVVLISIASIADPSLSPEGKHTLHAYTPATEPYDLWKGLDRDSPEYEALKEERSQVLWKAVERVIPDIRKRTEIEMVGTPLTHERFLRRTNGSYGPAATAGEVILPGPVTPIPGLMAVGDYTFPGIGLPAVAASGTVAANTLATLPQHWEMMNELGL